MLVANYVTDDPEAERKKRREYRKSLQREGEEIARREAESAAAARADREAEQD